MAAWAAQIEGVEWIVVLIIIGVLLLLGPKKIPELARALGRSFGELRKGRAQVEQEIKEGLTPPRGAGPRP